MQDLSLISCDSSLSCCPFDVDATCGGMSCKKSVAQKYNDQLFRTADISSHGTIIPGDVEII